MGGLDLTGGGPGDAGIVVRRLRSAELPAAVGVIARGMRDNPLHIAAYGDDPGRRLRRHARVMHALLATSATQEPLCAVQDGTIVGVAGVAPPGTCLPGRAQAARLVLAVLGLGPLTAIRVLRWTARWRMRDPRDAHVHLGPVAVDAHLQGRGIGSRLLAEHCRRLDLAGHTGYLETDKLVNVDFYRRFGFTVVGRDRVLGVPCWYMRREPPPLVPA